MFYYVREYAESKHGGASMLLDEYITDTPTANGREMQDPENNWGGYWVTNVTQLGGDADLTQYLDQRIETADKEKFVNAVVGNFFSGRKITIRDFNAINTLQDIVDCIEAHQKKTAKDLFRKMPLEAQFRVRVESDTILSEMDNAD